MKYKKDLKWFIVNVLGITEIHYYQLDFIERYFLKRCSKKINKVKTTKNNNVLKGQEIDVVIIDEAADIDWENLKKPKDL